MLKNFVEPGKPQMTMWRMRIACMRVPNATNTHSEYVMLIAFRLQQWLHERASMLFNTHIACAEYVMTFSYRDVGMILNRYGIRRWSTVLGS
jgi:hypothetical protein